MSETSTPIRVVLIEDHRLFREALRVVVESDKDFRIVGEADSVEQAITMLRRTPADLVIVDLRMFRDTGPAGVRALSRGSLNLRVVALSSENENDGALETVQAGVHGLLPRNTTSAALLDALRGVARGGIFLGPRIADQLFLSIRDGRMDKPPSHSQALAMLSPREIQLLRLIASGKSSKEIAVLLDLSVQTVRTYRKNLMKKLTVGNAAELTRFAMYHGLVGPKH